MGVMNCNQQEHIVVVPDNKKWRDQSEEEAKRRYKKLIRKADEKIETIFQKGRKEQREWRGYVEGEYQAEFYLI